MGGGYFQATRVRMGSSAAKNASRAAAARRKARANPPPSRLKKPKEPATLRSRVKRRTTNSRRAYNSERSAISMARAQRQAEKRQSKYNYGSYGGGGGIRTKGAIQSRRKKASRSRSYGHKKLGYSGKKTWHW